MYTRRAALGEQHVPRRGARINPVVVFQIRSGTRFAHEQNLDTALAQRRDRLRGALDLLVALLVLVLWLRVVRRWLEILLPDSAHQCVVVCIVLDLVPQ